MSHCAPVRPPRWEHPLASLLWRASQTLLPPSRHGPQPVVVGVSGGVDSVVLLHLLHQLAPARQLLLHVAHVDHALRPRSATTASQVHQLAEHLGLPWHSIRLDSTALRADPSGLEAAARRARYRFLCTLANDLAPLPQIPVVAVAHHADDQAETVLLRLLQGSGVQGLAAMRPLTLLTDPDLVERPVHLIRPLLEATRASIVAYARQQQLVWDEDESNQDERFSRNWIRQQLLPLLQQHTPSIVATLARTARVLATEADRLHGLDVQTLERLTRQPQRSPARHLLLDLAGLQQLEPASQQGVLRLAMNRLACDLREVGADRLEMLAAALRRATRTSGPHPLAGPLAWSVVALPGQRLCLSLHLHGELPLAPPGPWLTPADRQPTGPLPRTGETAVGGWHVSCRLLERTALKSARQPPGQRWQVFLDADQIQEPVLCAALPGQRIDPLGMGGRHKTLGKLFTDAKIAPALRPGWPVLVDRSNGRLLWVCGLAQSHSARITGTTRTVWMVQFTDPAQDEEPTDERPDRPLDPS